MLTSRQRKVLTFGPLYIIIGGILGIASLILLITTRNELWFIPLIGFCLIIFGGGGLVIFQREKRTQAFSLSSHS